MIETILKCRQCNQALCIDRFPKGQLKNGQDSKVLKNKLICKNCGKVYETEQEKKGKS